MANFVLVISALAAFSGKPATNPSTWVTSSDYPKQEIERGVSGVSRFTLLVNKSGGVDDCTITASSGSVALDATACALLKARAHFEPARDRDGHNMPFTYSSAVNWVVPEIVPLKIPAMSKIVTIAVDIDAKGVIENCAVTALPEGFSEDPTTPCAKFPAGRRMRSYVDAANKPVAVRMTLSETASIQQR